MGIGHAVGTDESVVAEVVVRSVVLVEVASVAVYLYTVFVLPPARLVDEIPDESALILRILAYDVPIFLESSFGVSHRMRVFALDERFVDIAFAIVDASFIVSVHGAVDVGELTGACLFVLYGSCGVFFFCPRVALLEVRSHTGLVAQRPEDDGRMVVSALHVALVPFEMRFGIDGGLCQRDRKSVV